MKKFIKSKLALQIVLTSFIAVLIIAGVVYAATTIGDDISTGGTLAVIGATTLTGQLNFATASSTSLASLDSLKVSSTGSTISGMLFGTCVVDIPSTVASSSSIADCTATGVTATDQVFITPVSTSTSIIFRSASSTAANTIQISVYNTGDAGGAFVGTVDPDASTWQWMAIR